MVQLLFDAIFRIFYINKHSISRLKCQTLYIWYKISHIGVTGHTLKTALDGRSLTFPFNIYESKMLSIFVNSSMHSSIYDSSIFIFTPINAYPN